MTIAPVSLTGNWSIDGKQIQAKLIEIGKAVGATASATGLASTATSVSSVSSQLAELQAEIATLQGEVGSYQTYTQPSVLTAYSVCYESYPGQVSVADASIAATCEGVVGLNTTTGNAGGSVQVAGNGATVTNSGWTFTVGPVFLGLTGALTQTPLATTGAVSLVQIGWAVSPTAVLIAIGEPVALTGGAASSVLSMTATGTWALVAVQATPIRAKTVIVQTAGFSATIPSSTAPLISYVLKPAGTLATGAVALPLTPVDGQKVELSSTQTITALTMTAASGATLYNGATTLTAGSLGAVRYVYDAPSTSWYPA